MKTMTLFVTLAITLLLVAGCGGGEHDSQGQDSTQNATSAAVYTCPMHPSVISDRPGACPVCGMALVKKSSAQTLSDAELSHLQSVSLSPSQRVLANVATVRAEVKSLRKEITLVGVVDVAETHQATVSARFRGRVEKLFVNTTGETVRRGQPLFAMYSPDLVTAQQEFMLALDGQRDMVEGMRSRLLLHFGMTAGQVAELERSRTVRSTMTFNSPIHGTVILKQVQEGQYIDEGTVMYQLADLSRVWISLDVYEKDVRHISTGQIVHITNESYPDEAFSGKVTFIDPVMNPATRTVRVRSEFSNLHGRLKPKMYVRAAVVLPIDNVLVIPLSALLMTGKRQVVWVETQTGMFEPRDVIVGMTTDREVQIVEGLKSGDIVASSGGYLIDSESALQQPSSPSHSGPGHQTSVAPSEEDHDHGVDDKDVVSPANNDIRINVKGKYTPSVIRVRLGQPVTLRFYRDETAKCTEEVVFEELNIRRTLPAYETTTVTFTPRESGEIHFACGMGMLHGKLIILP